jgi:hypothetical protein
MYKAAANAVGVCGKAVPFTEAAEASALSRTGKEVPRVGKEKLATSWISASAPAAATLHEMEMQEQASVEKRTTAQNRAARDE